MLRISYFQIKKLESLLGRNLFRNRSTVQYLKGCFGKNAQKRYSEKRLLWEKISSPPKAFLSHFFGAFFLEIP
jgi:hypothetical protein